VNYYELMVIFSSTLTDEEEKAQTQQVEELLRSQNGNIILVDHWGKRKLAYAIKRQRQGFYEWFYFEVEPGKIAEIDRKLKMSEQVLRFMILRMEKIQTQNMFKEAARRQEALQAPPVSAPATEPQPTASESHQEPEAEPAAPTVEEEQAETTGESSPEDNVEA
jgi:small subunit ribosomal protein S6